MSKRKKSQIDRYRQFFALFGTGEKLTSKEAEICEFIFWMRAINALRKFPVDFTQADINSIHKRYLGFIKAL